MKNKRKNSQDNHMREQFIAQLESCEPFFNLLAQLPDVDFFMKDREGRFIAAGPGILRRLNMTEESQIIGKRDHDIHPPRTVEELREDDLQVMKTGKPLINKIENLYSPDSGHNLFITTKVPIYNQEHEVMGIIGTTRVYHNSENLESEMKRISRSITYIQQHHCEAISPDDLAALENISVRQLNRRYQKVFGTPVGNFIMRTRIQSACNELLATNLSVSAIAVKFGFSDQSAFTRQFRQHTGETPLKYRARRK